MIQVTPAIALNDDEIRESFIRASGPGGQNVNKVSTAAELRFDAFASPSLPEAVKQRLARLAGSRMTKDGVLILRAETYRSQERNRADGLARLLSLIRQAAVVPKPRRATRPTKASKLRRLEGKAQRASVKKLRTAKPVLE